MAAGVAHEINNPLAVVVGNAEFVLEHLERSQSAGVPAATAAELQQAALEGIIEAQRELLSAAARIARIVSELKAFSRPEPEASGSADVRDAIEWAIRSTTHEFRHRARVSTKFEHVPRVDADETRLGQVFVNLLMNAAHAIVPGNVDANEVSIASTTDDQGRVVIAVSDTGAGMSSDVLSRIFEPFFTTKTTGVGTGLGLSICRGIVTSMGGELDVESIVGKGTTFRLKLPASAKQGPTASPLPEAFGVVQRGRLLLIDDEPMVLKALIRILDAHEIVCEEGAGSALARLKDDDRFDIIFCDLMMPNMTGMDFYEDLLSWHPAAARLVVFLTGGAMTSKAAHFLEAVPNRCIEKPFGTRNLRAIVQKILAAR
jgi:CheY-like chemotaxis protein